MRLDKFFSSQGLLSRKEATAAVRRGRVSVNGTPCLSPDRKIDEGRDLIALDGVPMTYRLHVYYLLHKPAGYVSATEEEQGAPCVTELLPEEAKKRGVFPCGRLDKNTTGLMLLTDDGPLSHRLLAPKTHVPKTYAFTVKFPLSDADVTALQNGVDIGGYVTAPCRVSLRDERAGEITLTEGKYHQIKLMMEAVHNQVTSLCRVSFGPITLPESLPEGVARPLTEEELAALLST